MNSPVFRAASIALLLQLAAASVFAAAPSKPVDKTLDPGRVHAIAQMLPASPQGVGRPISDRKAWQEFAKGADSNSVLKRAESILAEPVPEQLDDLFLDFSRTGNRTRWQKVAFERRSRLTWLVLAECMDNKGRFLPKIEEFIRAFCAEKTWVMPAHDRKLNNFEAKFIDTDLASSALAWNLATVDWMLGDKLSDATRKLIREKVHHFVLDPCQAAFRGQRKLDFWMRATHNWNAVCHAGVIGAALALIESRDERAEFVAAAEKDSTYFLSGFTPDGYCSEGLGYWDYGFGHFVMLSETIWQATGGKLDLFSKPEVKMPAAFGANIQIIGGVAPAFADCAVTAKPGAEIMWYVNHRLGLGLTDPQLDCETFAGHWFGFLFETALYGFPNSASQTKSGSGKSKFEVGLRTWFDSAGILIGRPATGSSCKMGVALKGGHNAEHHNHNDIGSYVVVLENVPVLLDPGAEVYTARTFSSKRYDSKLLNSFGHAVPVVAGKLQRPGRDAQAKILKTDFTERADTFAMDISSAYACPELKKLERTFVYSREGDGSLTVTDKVEFSAAQTFGTALILKGQWQRESDGSLLVFDGVQAVRVELTATADFSVEAEEIHEDGGVKPTRLGVNMKQPVTSATITAKITPFVDANASRNLLRNGGFEFGTWCWDLSENCQGAISDEKAASGKYSLKITDHDKKRGSSISSPLIPVDGEGSFALNGKVCHVSGRGIGMYVKFYNAKRELVNPRDGRGNIRSLGALQGAAGKWVPFSLPFKTPPETTAIQLWIHSGSTADVEAYLDELEIVKQSKTE